MGRVDDSKGVSTVGPVPERFLGGQVSATAKELPNQMQAENGDQDAADPEDGCEMIGASPLQVCEVADLNKRRARQYGNQGKCDGELLSHGHFFG